MIHPSNTLTNEGSFIAYRGALPLALTLGIEKHCPMARTLERDDSAGTGFLAQLKGLSVADLVQMNCLSGATCNVRVNSRQRTGWLHFSGGSIVHAEAGNLTGDAAVLEIANWQDGTFEPSSTERTATMSVKSSWQNLLLKAAQQRDELGRDNVVPIAQRPIGTGPATTRAGAIPTSTIEERLSPSQPPPASGRQSMTAPFVRISASGRIVTSRGEVDDLSAMAAFSVHLGQMIGTHLGLDALQGLEVRAGKQRTVIAVTADGQVDAMSSEVDAELAPLIRNAGL